MAVFIPQQLKARCLEFLIFPLARYCVRHALTLQDFLAVTKICFVKAAEEEIRKSGEKLNTSRICIITGMYRNEVNKILKSETVLAEQPLGPGARVLTQWSKNPDFLTKGGKPRVLSFKGENNEFQQLVHSVSRHLTPGTVLFELERMQLVERTPRGLRMKESIDFVGDNPEKGFELLSNDINSLISAVEENVFDRQKVSNVHYRAFFDNIYDKDLPLVRRWLARESKRFAKRVQDFLAKHDRDLNLHDDEELIAGKEVSFGFYSLTSHPEDGDWGKADDYSAEESSPEEDS